MACRPANTRTSSPDLSSTTPTSGAVRSALPQRTTAPCLSRKTATELSGGLATNCLAERRSAVLTALDISGGMIFGGCLGKKIRGRAGGGSVPGQRRRGSSAPKAHIVGAQSCGARGRRRRRCRHFRAHRTRRGGECRSCGHAVFSVGRGDLRLRPALLCGDVLAGTDQR